MNAFATMVLIGWVPATLLFFIRLPARRAVVASATAACLFLPNGEISLPGLPDLTKATAPMFGLLLGVLLFDSGRLAGLRHHWFDLPMSAWCLCPIATSTLNDLGLYDGVAGCVANAVVWGLPYFLGRIYLGDAEGHRELAIGILVGGLAYVPFCLWEIRMSPQLHLQIYGSGRFDTSFRYGGYRPSVFMSTGLELGMWMCAASLIGCWLWAGGLKKLNGRPLGTLLLPVLLITTFLCKSTGALLQMLIGLAALWGSWRLRSRLPFWLVLLVAPLYCINRTTGLWDGRDIVKTSNEWFGGDRAQSLEFRLDNEDMLIAKAKQQVLFGWGGYGRARVYDEETGRDLTITDGLWIIVLGNNGAIGLAAVIGTIIGPAAAWAVRNPPKTWKDPGMAAGAALSALLGIYMIDNLSNAMFNPIYLLAAGSIAVAPSGRRDGGQLVQGMIEGEGRNDLGSRDQEGEIAFALGREEVAESAGATGAPRAWSEAERAWSRVLAGLDHESRDSPATRRDTALTLEHLSHSLARLGRWSEAIETRKLAVGLRDSLLSTDPAGEQAERYLADTLNDLSWLMACAPDPSVRDASMAVNLAGRATRMFPEQASYQNTLAAGLCRIGDPSAAIAVLNRAINLGRGGTAFDYLLLSIAHAGLKNADTASSMLSHAEALATDRMRAWWSFATLRREASSLLFDLNGERRNPEGHPISAPSA